MLELIRNIFGKIIDSDYPRLLAILGVLCYFLAVLILLLLAGLKLDALVIEDRGIQTTISLATACIILVIIGAVLIKNSLLSAKKNEIQHRAGDDFKEEDYHRVFELSESVSFYNLIAEFYEERNTEDYRSTYDLIHSLSQIYKGSLDNVKICDLGGGTGALYRKFKHHSVSWVDVDLSVNALNLFDSKYLNTPNVESREFDITSDSFISPNEVFDIVIISFVLSSLPTNFPFKNIKEILSTGGVLIIADNHPQYSNGKLYGFKNIRGENYALRIKPINPDALKSMVENEGFVRKDIQYVYIKDDLLYSQVQAYQIA